MKKTALTMTDSERPGNEKSQDLPISYSKTLQEENQELKTMVEQQGIALDMIMRKYREQVDSLTKASHVDVRKLYYKRFLDTIVNQANKMDEMTRMMRKNLLVIFKYEEIMRQIESENESLRGLVRKLTAAAKESKEKAVEEKVAKNDVSSQTCLLENLFSTADKAVDTSSAEEEFYFPRKDEAHPRNQNCTDMVPYTSFSDNFAHLGTLSNANPLTKPLNVNAAFDMYMSRFDKETGISLKRDKSVENDVGGEKAGKLEAEDSSELVTSLITSETLTEEDTTLTENSIGSLMEDSSSKQDVTEDIFDDVQESLQL